MRSRYLVPRKVKYSVDVITGACLTQCPNGEEHKVGDMGCAECEWFRGDISSSLTFCEGYVFCVRKLDHKNLPKPIPTCPFPVHTINKEWVCSVEGACKGCAVAGKKKGGK
jgi:hypothetical protein